MTWLLLWLEVLGIMAVVFATGIGIGFLASWILRRGERRKAATPRREPSVAYAAPSPVATAPMPVELPVEAPQTKAPEAIAPAPLMRPMAEPSLQTVPYGPISATMRFPLNAFGRVSITRPDTDQPPS